MAKQKTVDVVFRRVRNPKTGKSKFVKVSKTKTVSTNVSKGANTGSRPWKSDAAALKSEKITADLTAQKAKFASRTANVASLASAATNIAKTAVGAVAPQQSTEQVQQAVQGGMQPSNPSRDDDNEDEDNPYVV